MRALLASLLILLVHPGLDDPGVAGYVIAPDGMPVSSGTVVAHGAFVSTPATIDRTGRFRLLPPRPGPYQFVVTVPGFVPSRLAVTVPASRSLRLPIIHLQAGSYVRMRFATAAGEPIIAPLLRRRVFDAAGNAIADDGRVENVGPTDYDGAVTIGPLPRGTMTAAVDMPLFARTRLPDVTIGDGATVLDRGTVVIQQPGAALDVDVVDGAGVPVPNHEVLLEDPRPRSPLVFQPLRTDRRGRATFDRLAAGRYRLRSTAIDRCNNTALMTSRDLPVPADGTIAVQLIVGGRATFHVTSTLGPMRAAVVVAAPDVPQPPLPAAASGTLRSGCSGTTDADGRVTLTNFPPGPTRVDVRLGNSTYERRVEVPPDGRDVAVTIPDGFLPAAVVDAVTNQPISRATITWTGSGARVEGTTNAVGEALLEGVGTGPGTLVASARTYRDAQEALTEPPGVPHTIALPPLPRPTPLRVRVTTTSGTPLEEAVVALISTSPGAVPRVAVTDAKGLVTFGDLPAASSQLMAFADGFAASAMRIGPPPAADVMFALPRGFRIVAAVELPPASGPQRVRVTNESTTALDDLLDLDSDRGLEPPGRLTIGPLAPGAYVVELDGAAGRRQQRVRIVDRDVSTTFR